MTYFQYRLNLFLVRQINSHTLNLLDSKQAISSTERQAYILRLRKLSFLIAKKYLENREKINFPLMKNS